MSDPIRERVDAIQRHLSRGEPSPALADLLAAVRSVLALADGDCCPECHLYSQEVRAAVAEALRLPTGGSA